MSVSAVVEILDSDSESDDPIYKFKFDIEDLITSTLNEFGDPKKNEESPQMTETLNNLSGQIKGIESKIISFFHFVKSQVRYCTTRVKFLLVKVYCYCCCMKGFIWL